MQKAIILLLAVVLHLVLAQNPDTITSLPNFKGEINFKQYAGYIQVNETRGRNLFYWFVESQNNPASDPVVLWLNGGPGCSSLTGFATEHGPFNVEQDGTFVVNPYSWNTVANVIYLESPAGVGFSYSETPADYKEVNDIKTASDSYNFLVQFFAKYPQFAKNQFFVAGESYAGHYVPTLVSAIHDGNQAGKNLPINIKGFLVGNGITDSSNDANSQPAFMYHHMLISQDDYHDGYDACKGDFYKNANLPKCGQYLYKYMSQISGLNPYNIYADCANAGNSKDLMFTPHPLDKKMHPLFSIGHRVALDPPCIDGTAMRAAYNNKAVQAAIHAKAPADGWDVCNEMINSNYDWTYESMIPFYQKLLPNYRAIIYTGDIDFAVNGLGSEATVVQLNRTLVDDWAQWTVDNQVAGFVKRYEQLDFLTIKGAGHMVPTDKPKRALYFFSKFLKNQPY